MDILAYIDWNVSDEIFKIWIITIRWYGLLFALGFIFGYQVLNWIFNTEGKKPKDLEKLTIYIIVGVVVGARLGHCLFYEPEKYLSDPIAILEIWNGGLASHGAALGMIIALLLFHRKHKHLKYSWLADRLIFAILPGAFLVRLGNLFNSEILGHQANVPWAFLFYKADPNPVPRHPVQLYEGIGYLLIFVILFFTYKKKKADIPPGRLTGLGIALIFIMRFIVEFFKTEQADFTLGIPLNLAHLLSIPFIIAGLYIIYISYRKKS